VATRPTRSGRAAVSSSAGITAHRPRRGRGARGRGRS
jgi:hypothetical protein